MVHYGIVRHFFICIPRSYPLLYSSSNGLAQAYFTALYTIIALNAAILYCSVFYVQHGTVLFCMVQYCTALTCTILNSVFTLIEGTVLHLTAISCKMMRCIVLHNVYHIRTVRTKISSQRGTKSELYIRMSLPLSLLIESTSYVFSFRMMFSYFVTTG